jgi:hypothetical protein
MSSQVRWVVAIGFFILFWVHALIGALSTHWGLAGFAFYGWALAVVFGIASIVWTITASDKAEAEEKRRGER